MEWPPKDPEMRKVALAWTIQNIIVDHVKLIVLQRRAAQAAKRVEDCRDAIAHGIDSLDKDFSRGHMLKDVYLIARAAREFVTENRHFDFIHVITDEKKKEIMDWVADRLKAYSEEEK